MCEMRGQGKTQERMKKNVQLQLFNTLCYLAEQMTRVVMQKSSRKTEYKLNSNVQKIPRKIKLTFVTPLSNGSYMVLVLSYQSYNNN